MSFYWVFVYLLFYKGWLEKIRTWRNEWYEWKSEWGREHSNCKEKQVQRSWGRRELSVFEEEQEARVEQGEREVREVYTRVVCRPYITLQAVVISLVFYFEWERKSLKDFELGNKSLIYIPQRYFWQSFEK